MAINSATADIRAGKGNTIPLHLQAPLFKGYKYPHDYGGYVEQQYLPDKLKGKVYYNPKNNGYENEQAAKAFWDKIKK